MELVHRGVEIPSGRFEFDLGDAHLLVGVSIRDGVVDLTSIEVRASNVTADLLRGVPIRDLRNAVRDQLHVSASAWLDGRALLAQLYRGAGHDVPEHLARAEKHAESAIDSLRHRDPMGPRPTPDESHRLISLALIDTYRREERRPVALLAERMELPRSTVADRVRKARAAGWLAETTPGRAGAEPGPRLIEWLNENGDTA